MFQVIPAMVGVAVVIVIHEYNRRKMVEYYKEQDRKNKEAIDALYKKYVR
jgi:hypothetical protein